jgi:hypothetical protein
MAGTLKFDAWRDIFKVGLRRRLMAMNDPSKAFRSDLTDCLLSYRGATSLVAQRKVLRWR